ncbi:TIGR00341 family protein [Microbacterium sp. 2FI]|uniref:TIGR00341 family protein n=1 Tax=Microbacterium sp. 2FI TaxID=2502193 RepID=UPI0010F86106|nr:TIGR00341 family protein [Microbacterium sp. 2FI]
MSRLTRTLIPPAQRQPIEALNDALDLGYGDALAKRTGFLIMLVLSAIIAISGVLADSTATVIGAMIIAPLGTPILGIALGIVSGHLSLVLRSMMWVAIGLVVVVVLGWLFTFVIADPASLETNSQILGRTSPHLLDLVAALATGTAGAFAMCRRDLSAVLPGVAISISLVPPLGVVGVCMGQGAWDAAFGALFLFLSNVVALVIAGSIVFTVSGYARDPGSSPTANRRRAYVVVTVLALIVALPLAANTLVSVVLAGWTTQINAAAEAWLADETGARVDDVTWRGLVATIEVTDPDGELPPTDDLSAALAGLPGAVSVVVDVGVGSEIPVR